MKDFGPTHQYCQYFFRSFALFVISVCGPQTYSFSNASTVAEFTMVGWIDKTRRMGVGHPHISSRPSTHGRGKPLPTTDPGHHRQRAGRRRYRADTEQGQAGDTSSDVPVETSQSPDSRPLAHLFLFQLTNHPRIQAPRDFPGHKSDSFCQLLDCPQKIAQIQSVRPVYHTCYHTNATMIVLHIPVALALSQNTLL